MDEKTKGKIAYELLKHRFRKDGSIKIGKNVDSDMEATAKETGIDVKELKTFVRNMFQELFEEAWGK